MDICPSLFPVILGAAAAPIAIAILSAAASAAVSSAMAPKPKTPKIPAPVPLGKEDALAPLPKTQDMGKIKASEKRQLQRRSTQTTMTSNWLSEPSLLTRQLGV